MKRTYNLKDKHNSSYSNCKNKSNTNLNNSFLKKTNNEIGKMRYDNVEEKEKPSSNKILQKNIINKVSAIKIKKEMLKNIDYLIYRSNKI